MKRSPLRTLGAVCIVAAGFCLIAVMLTIGQKNTRPGNWDFIEYWAAEQQFLHHANPYDAAAILHLEQAEGFDHKRPEFWYGPPVVLILAVPLGFLSAKAALILWLLLLFASLSASLWIIWLLNGRPPTLLHLLGYLFPPAIACLMAGQISIFLMLALMLFLWLHKSHPFLAGAALLPCVSKPHLFLPFAVTLFLWVGSKKAYPVLAGFFAALGAGCTLTFCLDVQAWSQYSRMMVTESILNEYVATLSTAMRVLVDRQALWLQFVPEAGACIWAIWYFWTRRDRWNWMNHGLLLLLVSSICTPYGWFFDESILLPAVLTGVLNATESRRSLAPIAVIAGITLIEVNSAVEITSPFYLWTAPAWLAWYLYATRGKRANSKELEVAASEPAGTQRA